MARAHGLRSLGFFFAFVGASAGCLVEQVGSIGASDEHPKRNGGTPTWEWASKTPVPISGGTLLVTPGGIAVAADPDRDAVWLVDLTTRAMSKVALDADDEPGRVVQDAAGRIHVALRRGGAVATLDMASASLIRRVPVCPAPRGVAYDAKLDAVHVACTGGEIVSFDASSGAVIRSLRLPDNDLRDIVVRGDDLVVSRFRSAEVLLVSPANADSSVLVTARHRMPSLEDEPHLDTWTPTVAWRLISRPKGGLLLLHQRSLDTEVHDFDFGGYSTVGCDGLVNSTVTALNDDGSPHVDRAMMSLRWAQGAVDVATDEDGFFVVVSPNGAMTWATVPELEEAGTWSCFAPFNTRGVIGEPVAVARWNGSTIVQTREPTSLVKFDAMNDPFQYDTFWLSPGSGDNRGHDLFHQSPPVDSLISCASCHPEGGDDGHTWLFESVGKRRTQSAAGGVLSTAPLHWDGDMPDFPALVEEVYRGRMGGPKLDDAQTKAFASWIQSIPAPIPSPRGSAAQIVRGSQLFLGAGCADCHGGPRFTNDKTVDVGTGKPFQVPSLIGVSARAPYFHDGCAATLRDRFDPAHPACNGGDAHGKVSPLSSDDVDDLVAYLEAL